MTDLTFTRGTFIAVGTEEEIIEAIKETFPETAPCRENYIQSVHQRAEERRKNGGCA
jgi:hypothetical protein